MIKPSGEQIKAVRAALKDIGVELAGWDPHVVALFRDEMQKAQIVSRMKALGWHEVPDPGNENAEAGMVEFSLEKPCTGSPAGYIPKHRKQRFGYLFISMGGLALFLSIVFLATCMVTEANTVKFQKEGHAAKAEIERAYLSGGRSRVPYAEYRYRDQNGTERHDDDAYPFPDWRDLKAGQAIDILYLQSSPGHSRILRRQEMLVGKAPPWGISEGTALAGLLLIVTGITLNRRRISAVSNQG